MITASPTCPGKHFASPAKVFPGRAIQLLCLAFLPMLAACGSSNDNWRAESVPDVTVVSFNVLHGLTCPVETDGCRLPDRQDLFFDWLESIDCPDVVLLQEMIGIRVIELLQERVVSRCDGVYQVLYSGAAIAQNFTLSRYPALQTNEDVLMGNLRRLWHTQIDHPTGIVDVFNTHLAAGIDLVPCDESCPEECQAAGAQTSRDCQTIQVAALAERHAAPGSLRILGGDFNARPDSFSYRHLVEANDWTDAYLAAGNPECDPATGIGCTSGREDDDLSDMESPALGVRSRIDYIFLQIPEPGGGTSCRYELDSYRDDDGDGLATKIFAGDPNPFAEACGPLPDPICWPSDHSGMQADINCR